jgi:hypothetical protein
MTKLPVLAVFCATTLTLVNPHARSTTSEDLEAGETLPQSLVYAQNIIAVTRASMGLATKDLRSTTASVSMSCST